MEKETRLKEAYEYARYAGKIKNQKDLADKMKTSTVTVSRALNGDGKYLTDSFLKRFNRAFNNIFDIDYLLNGIGKLCPEAMEATDEELFEPDRVHKDDDEEKDKEIEELKRTIEQLKEKINQIEGREQLKDELLKSKDRENELLRRMLDGKL